MYAAPDGGQPAVHVVQAAARPDRREHLRQLGVGGVGVSARCSRRPRQRRSCPASSNSASFRSSSPGWSLLISSTMTLSRPNISVSARSSARAVVHRPRPRSRRAELAGEAAGTVPLRQPVRITQCPSCAPASSARSYTGRPFSPPARCAALITRQSRRVPLGVTGQHEQVPSRRIGYPRPWRAQCAQPAREPRANAGQLAPAVAPARAPAGPPQEGDHARLPASRSPVPRPPAAPRRSRG